MISENTVLILGAGASKPYGYPTALELRREIINNLIPLLKKYSEDGNKSEGFDTHPYIKKIQELINVFKYSSTNSIDLFLSRNKEYQDIGKQIITFLLANYELGSKFREDIIDNNCDWYFFIYEILTRGIFNSDEISKFAENKVTIITFNYDRSFEHFLYESLQYSFKGKQNEINELMLNFNIIHVYGKIAPLNWESSEGVKYRDSLLRDYYADYFKNIQIIYEERESKVEKIIEAISNANKIFFLGFGYAEENLKAIGLDKPILKKHQRVFGTAFNLTDSEIIKNSYLLRSANIHMMIEKFQLYNCDSLVLLRNHL